MRFRAPAQVPGRPESEHVARGVTARDLLLRTGHAGKIDDDELERWLVASGLATSGDGRMRPTQRPSELAGALAFLG